MGEIKSVKVDNWGVFFLQKLQNFFNKTDYCDLTLQFFDNSQLKVHRLVLSACTDYFNVLEQTCEVIDDALIMPSELQADVVVPIVNFMYTGTLEFELKMYGKLLKTAKEMNMTVLLRLLEAHRRTMDSVNRQQGPSSPKSVRRRGPLGTTATATQFSGNQQQQQRRIFSTANSTLQQQRRVAPTKNIATNASTSSGTIPQQMQFRQQIGSTSLLKTSPGNSSQVKAQYGNVTVYETTPQIKNEPDEYAPTTSKPQQQQNQATSPFEQLRKGYNNNKRPAVATFISPPAKKPNIEDVKEFAEQQRMRKQIAAEYGDADPCEYESMLDDDIHNYDDDDDGGAGTTTTSTNSTAVQVSTSRQHQQQPQGSATITFKQEQNDKPPTIVVKDSSNSKMNHAKIISEVLRQYPHLVKSNKNIKLKIMPNVGGQTQKIIVKKDQLDSLSATDAGPSGQQQQQKPQVSSQIILKVSDKAQPQQKEPQQPPHSIITKPSTTQKAIAATVTSTTQAVAAATSSAPGPQVQKRRIDSKTMHSLIALGAENTTGPWLCLRCGVNGRPISIPSYRGFRRHLINTHKENIDAALCEQCGWRSKNNRELHYHMLIEHKIKTTLYAFPECLMCAEIFLDTNTLNQHMVNSHPEEKQQCIYCNKIFARELQLYTHVKTFHKIQALEDGIIDYSDEEFTTAHDEEQQQQLQNVVKDKKDTKIKILSDISLPSASSMIKLEPSSEAAALSTVASGIATSIGVTSATAEELMDTSGENVGEPKFVNVDGNEMLLTDEQRKEILSQLNQEHGSGGVVMVLNEPSEFPAAAANAFEDELHDVSPVEEDAEPDAAAAAIAEKDNDNAGADGTSDFDDSQIYNEFSTTTQSHAAESDAATTIDAAIAAAVDDEEMPEVKKNTSSNLEESKESIDNLEWAENLISAHEMADEVAADSKKTDVAEQQKAQKEDDISKKLKELTGDWSEDDNDEDDEHEEEEKEHEEEEKEHEEEEKEHEADAAEEETETAVEAAKEQTNTEDEPEGEEAEEVEEGVYANLTAEVEEKAQKEQQQEDISDNEDILQSVLNAAAAAEVSAGTINEPKEDEDDIDDAMKCLHKEDDIEDDKENQKNTAETATKPRADDTAENMDVDANTDADDENANNRETKLAEEKESNKESKIKETTNKSPTPSRDEKENINSIASVAEVDDKSMLTDLISFAGEEQEFIEEKTSETTKEASALNKLDDEKTLESKEIASTEAKNATEEVPVTDVVAAAAVTISTDSKDAIIKEEAAEKKKTDVTTTAASSSTSKTEDKVKSLISEWGDDEDDDDDDIGGGNNNKDDEDDL